MDIVEEAGRRRMTLKLENPGSAYSEMRDLLETRMSFDHVHEEKYFNDVEEGKVRARLETSDGFDRFTNEKLKIFLTIDPKKARWTFRSSRCLSQPTPRSSAITAQSGTMPIARSTINSCMEVSERDTNTQSRTNLKT